MSRGGRGGGFRGGRGGAGGAFGKMKIGGQDVPWDFDPELKVSGAPSEVFPDITFSRVRPATAFEKASVARFRALRRRIHEGPFYTGSLGDVGIGTGPGALGMGGARATADDKRKRDFDPFEDMPTYTHKYKVQARKLPRFDTRQYQLRFFPKELWSTIDPSRAPSKSSRNPRPVKRARLADGDADGDAELPADDDPTKAAADDDDPDRAAEEEPGDPEDDFSEDDSEMGADYNAENYFDGGDDDAGSDNGGGGGDGGDYD